MTFEIIRAAQPFRLKVPAAEGFFKPPIMALNRARYVDDIVAIDQALIEAVEQHHFNAWLLGGKPYEATFRILEVRRTDLETPHESVDPCGSCLSVPEDAEDHRCDQCRGGNWPVTYFGPGKDRLTDLGLVHSDLIGLVAFVSEIIRSRRESRAGREHSFYAPEFPVAALYAPYRGPYLQDDPERERYNEKVMTWLYPVYSLDDEHGLKLSPVEEAENDGERGGVYILVREKDSATAL